LEGTHESNYLSLTLQCTDQPDIQEATVSIAQAEERARHVLKNLEKDSEIHEIQREVNHHDSSVIALAAWLWSILSPILRLFPAIGVTPTSSALFLPSKVTIMDKAEEARKSQQEVVEFERLAIETRDT